MERTDLEIWESIEARLRSVEWSKPKTTVRLASYDSARVVDAWEALCKNAAAAEADAPEPPRLTRGRHPRRLALPHISDEVKAEYDYAFKEREGLNIDSGMVLRCSSKMIEPHCCAHHATLLEVGDVQFYAHASPLPYVRGMVRAERGNVTSDLLCSRCESVGHLVEACPFGIADVDVMNVARLRRERRISAGERRRMVG